MLNEEGLASKRPRREAKVVSYREYEETEVYREVDDRDVVPSQQRRRSGRVTIKELPLDALAGAHIPVTGAAEFTYALGGAETGGNEADRILREVETDDSIIALRAQFVNCRRVALSLRTRIVAAAIIEMHSAGVLEIPILASAKAARQQGYGSVLLALLMELAVGSLGATMLVVSATDESRRFWLRQGLHTTSHCAPVVRDAMRVWLLSNNTNGPATPC